MEMSMETGLLEKALELSPSERVAFAESILASIDHEDETIRQAWVTEVEQRRQSIREGSSQLLDYATVMGE